MASGIDQPSTSYASSSHVHPQPSSSSSISSETPEVEISIWSDEKISQQETRAALNEAVSTMTSGRVSPIQSTLNTEWTDISRTQQNYYVRKVNEVLDSVLETVAPGQKKKTSLGGSKDVAWCCRHWTCYWASKQKKKVGSGIYWHPYFGIPTCRNMADKTANFIFICQWFL